MIQSSVKKISPYLVYPFFLLFAYSIYFNLLGLSNNIMLSLAAAISLAGILFVCAEYFFPLHQSWKPNFKEFANDILFYTLVVQIVYPISIFLLVHGLMTLLGHGDGVVYQIWPSGWPLLGQFVLFCMIGEFFQYAWHRACHTWKVFWPIHAVHHAPQKLYSANTVRFHFLDKSVEFIFTILIFLMLGASIELLGLYYIFYAITGFIQHSNMNVKLGWFDYIIASGETHRFHHDVDPQKSKCNYANNFVVWDLIFKTFKRDLEHPIEVVGIKSTQRPITLMQEFIFPFKQWKGMLATQSLKESLTLFFIDFLLPLKMISTRYFEYQPLRAALANPMVAQEELLLKIIKENSKTEFGNEHQFLEIKSIAEYRKLVPIRSYEQFEKYTDQIIAGGHSVLTTESPLSMTKTSGTTGRAKYIPYTKSVENSYKRAQAILSYSIYRDIPGSFDGLIYTVTGAKFEEKLKSNLTAGTMSGMLWAIVPRFLKKKYTMSDQISALTDYSRKYLHLAALALLNSNVTSYASPNPATILKIFEVINSRRDEIRQLLSQQLEMGLERFAKNRKRALQLLESKKDLTIGEVWPHLRAVTMWTGGSCAFLIPKVQKQLVEGARIIELGYMSTEFYGTVTVDAKANVQVPTLLDNFFEFIELKSYECGGRETLLLSQLESGKEYYVIVTTKGGLYRYFINDIVRVESFYDKTPILKFVQKGKGITNLVGEKLSEHNVVSFFKTAPGLVGQVEFFICLADQINQTYELFLELTHSMSEDSRNEISEYFDRHLGNANNEYKDKRASGRLGKPKLTFLKRGTVELYKEFCILAGQREAQFKFLHLQYKKDVAFAFEEHES